MASLGARNTILDCIPSAAGDPTCASACIRDAIDPGTAGGKVVCSCSMDLRGWRVSAASGSTCSSACIRAATDPGMTGVGGVCGVRRMGGGAIARALGRALLSIPINGVGVAVGGAKRIKTEPTGSAVSTHGSHKEENVIVWLARPAGS